MSGRKNHSNIRKIIMAGLLAALGIVLGRSFCTVYITESLKITFDKIPVFLAGIWLGPLYGAAVAAVSDIFGAAVLSSYGWTPLLTVSPVLMGLISGLLNRYAGDTRSKKTVIIKTAVIVAVTELMTSFLLQTFFLTQLYGSTYTARLATRLPVCAVVALAEIVVISALRCSSAISVSVDKYLKNEKRRPKNEL